MSSLNFPENPSPNDAYFGWVWNGAAWVNKVTPVTTESVELANAPFSTPEGLVNQSDANVYIADSLEKLLDEDGNPIGGGDVDLDWVNNNEDKVNISLGWDNTLDSRGEGQVLIGSGATCKDESVAIGRDANADVQAVAVGPLASADFSGIAIGNGARTYGDNAISLGSYAGAVSGEFAIGSDINTVNFSGATVQAADFIDADGNSIVGGDVDLTGYATETYVGQEIAKIPAAPIASVNGKTGAVSLTHTDVGALPSSYTPPVPDVSGEHVASAARLKSYEHGLTLGSTPGFGGNNLFVYGSNAAGGYESRVMLGNSVSQQFSIVYAANFYKGGSPMLAAVDLIDTFTTIKSAITNETTVEGLRSSVISGLDAVLAKLQAMEDEAEEEGHKA